MEPGVREGDAVGRDQKVGVLEVRGSRVQEAELDRPLPELRAGRSARGLPGAAGAGDAPGRRTGTAGERVGPRLSGMADADGLPAPGRSGARWSGTGMPFSTRYATAWS